jgi:hypothetical protein
MSHVIEASNEVKPDLKNKIADETISLRALDFACDVIFQLYLSDNPIYARPLERGLVVYRRERGNGDIEEHEQDLTVSFFFSVYDTHTAFDEAVRKYRRYASPHVLELVREIRKAYRRDEQRVHRHAERDRRDTYARNLAKLQQRLNRAA